MDEVEDPHARIKALPVASRIDEKYAIVRRLGAGGMGVVYQCNNELIDKAVAVKVLTSSDKGIITRFRREAKVSERLRQRHAAFVEIFDMGTFEGYPYIVMELLRGGSLFDCLHARRITADGYLAIHLECCSALAAAHADGVVHRDLKPENIFIEESGRVRILDLGIAKMVQPGDGMQTGTHALMGTPQFMSPEQCRGAKLIDHRSDIYSMALVAYWVYAGGQMPFVVGQGEFDWLVAHVRDEPIPLQTFAPQLAPGLIAAVHRGLEKEPSRRFQTMEEMRQAFACFTSDVSGRAITTQDLAIRAAAPSAPTQEAIPATPLATAASGSASLAKGEISVAPRPARRGLALAALGVAAAAAGAGFWWTHHSTPPNVAPKPAVMPAAPPPEAQEKFRVFIDVTPADATLTVDGAGRAPPYILEGEAGHAFKLEAKRRGYHGAEQTVTIGTSDQRVAVRLEPDHVGSGHAGTAQLIINVKPCATCALGGKSQETPCTFRLPPGTHKVILTNQALKRREEVKANLEGGEVKKLDYDWRQ
jgi:tRNA A-37 threonylcarbamoyl transferase component Bud32